MPLTGAAASRLEPIVPMLMSFPDWYNFRVCLILQKPTVRRLASRRHCHNTANRFPIIDLWRLSTTYVVQIYSGAWTP